MVKKKNRKNYFVWNKDDIVIEDKKEPPKKDKPGLAKLKDILIGRR